MVFRWYVCVERLYYGIVVERLFYGISMVSVWKRLYYGICVERLFRWYFDGISMCMIGMDGAMMGWQDLKSWNIGVLKRLKDMLEYWSIEMERYMERVLTIDEDHGSP